MHAVVQKPCGSLEKRMQVDDVHALLDGGFLDNWVDLAYDCRIHDTPVAVVAVGLQCRENFGARGQVREGIDQRLVIVV